MAGNGSSAAGDSVEVVGVARRRRFTEAFKRRVLDEVDRADRGDIGLILRREGLYSSQLAEWRRWRSGMGQTNKQGSKKDVSRAEFERVVKENAQLKLKLRKAELMLELQKKAAELLKSDDEISGSAS